MISIESRNGKRAYETVAERVRKFRETHSVDSGWQIVTEHKFPKDDLVLCRATIIDPEGRVVATGTAEEIRGSTFINKTSAVENAETSAIGRALFSAGFGGGEFCSADELAIALRRQEELLAAESSVSRKRKPSHELAGPAERPSATAPSATTPADAQQSDGTEELSDEGDPERSLNPISPEAFGLPADCGIAFFQEGDAITATDQTKGATFNNRGFLKRAGFSFDGRYKVWQKKEMKDVA